MKELSSSNKVSIIYACDRSEKDKDTILDTIDYFVRRYALIEFVDEFGSTLGFFPDTIVFLWGRFGSASGFVAQTLGSEIMVELSPLTLFRQNFICSFLAHEMLHVKENKESGQIVPHFISMPEYQVSARQLLCDTKVNLNLSPEFSLYIFIVELLSALPLEEMAKLVDKNFRVKVSVTIPMYEVLLMILSKPHFVELTNKVEKLKVMYKKETELILATRMILQRYLDSSASFDSSFHRLASIFKKLKRRVGLEYVVIFDERRWRVDFHILPPKISAKLDRKGPVMRILQL